MSTSTNKREIFWVLPLFLTLLVPVILLASSIISETQYQAGAERAKTQIIARLRDADLKEAATLVLADSFSCIRRGLSKVETGPTASIPYLFSRSQRAVGEQIGYEQAKNCYRGRLKALHTVGLAPKLAAMLEASQ